jgi:hypothetical protein
MALRKYDDTPSCYDVIRPVDNLRGLLRQERLRSHHENGYEVLISSGLREGFPWWVSMYELYTPDGCFMGISQEQNIPRIVALVMRHGEPHGISMLVNSSRYLGVGHSDFATSMGFLGMFVRPEHRGRGLSALALRCVGEELMMRMKGSGIEDPCVQSNGFIRPWAGRNFPVPVLNIY